MVAAGFEHEIQVAKRKTTCLDELKVQVKLQCELETFGKQLLVLSESRFASICLGYLRISS